MNTSMKSVGSATLAAAVVIGTFIVTPPARAAVGDIALNGKYKATSLGNWAKIDDTARDIPTVIQTWTISSSCTDAQDCDGTVVSDQGWTAKIRTNDGEQWFVHHDVTNFEVCPDGNGFTGHQIYKFTPVTDDNHTVDVSPTLSGWDKTIGESGACRVNKWLTITMPFRLDKL